MNLLQQTFSEFPIAKRRNLGNSATSKAEQPSEYSTELPQLFFRKPYARCLRCVASTKIKCESCLQEITKKLKVLAEKSEENQKRARTQAEKKRHPHPPKIVYQVRNSFELYLEESIKRRVFPRERNQYPMKSINYTLQAFKQPKFQTWKHKSYERMKDIVLKNIRGGHLRM